MGGEFLRTIMTDKAFSMAVVIDLVFPSVQHSHFHFHIIENSRNHIGALKANEGL